MRFQRTDNDPVLGEAIDALLLRGPGDEQEQLTAAELSRAIALLATESKKAYRGPL